MAALQSLSVRYGQNLAFLINLRSIYEPYNYTRSVYGFDTFTGLTEKHIKDGSHPSVEEHNFATPKHYCNYLEEVLNCHEAEGPMSHIQKLEIVVGDVRNSMEQFLEQNPNVIFSLLYFDLDLYQPTKTVLELIEPRIGKLRHCF